MEELQECRCSTAAVKSGMFIPNSERQKSDYNFCVRNIQTDVGFDITRFMFFPFLRGARNKNLLGASIIVSI
jgi:hypothetical protein